MINLYTIKEVKEHLTTAKNKGQTIGFVPTMGALHEGHLSLVKEAKKECDVIVVSVFVNPTQFNNSEDLELYPRTEEKDAELLKQEGVDFVFLPTVKEIYPEDYKAATVNLGFIGRTMEGRFRPGHFDGVVEVVSRLFDIVSPIKAYFGRKDFQQVAVIKEMVKQLNYSVKIVEVDTKRNDNGLALSSRNLRLSEQQLNDALIINETLKLGKTLAKKLSPAETLQQMKNFFGEGVLELEYLKIVHPDNLRELIQYWVPGATACIVAYSGEVRLIDNMELI